MALIDRLQLEVERWAVPEAGEAGREGAGTEAFGDGFWSRVKEGLGRAVGAAGATSSGLVLAVGRSSLHSSVSRFLGDVLTYVDDEGPIVDRVVASLEAGHLARTPADPHLVVVAHSMGGNVVYDILSGFRPDLRVDVLVTVGSQVALFEELKLFRKSDPDMPQDHETDRVKKPPGVGTWLNVFDMNDVLSFATEGVFAETADFEYRTGKGLMGAHGSYFSRPSFHARLGERLAAILGA